MVADFGFKDGVARNYPVADFGMDHNIIISLNNSKNWKLKKNADGKYDLPDT